MSPSSTKRPSLADTLAGATDTAPREGERLSIFKVRLDQLPPDQLNELKRQVRQELRDEVQAEIDQLRQECAQLKIELNTAQTQVAATTEPDPIPDSEFWGVDASKRFRASNLNNQFRERTVGNFVRLSVPDDVGSSAKDIIDEMLELSGHKVDNSKFFLVGGQLLINLRYRAPYYMERLRYFLIDRAKERSFKSNMVPTYWTEFNENWIAESITALEKLQELGQPLPRNKE